MYLLALFSLWVSVATGQSFHDNNANCQCYQVVSNTTPTFFSNYRLWDFRYFANDTSSFPDAPDPSVSLGSEGTLQSLLQAPSFTADWNVQTWGTTPTTESPIIKRNSYSNVFFRATNNTDLGESNPAARTFLTFRTIRNAAFQSAAEIENLQKNIMYASVRFRARVRGDAGACAGMFTVFDNNNEADIEVLTKDKKTTYHYTNQPDVKNGNDVPGASLQKDNLLNWTDWHTHRIDWLPGIVRSYLDDKLVAENTINVPKKPSYIDMNMWSDGGVWSGTMAPGDEAELHVAWVQAAFNTSGANILKRKDDRLFQPEKWGSNDHILKKRANSCTKVCIIDNVAQTGVPQMLASVSAINIMLRPPSFALLTIFTAIEAQLNAIPIPSLAPYIGIRLPNWTLRNLTLTYPFQGPGSVLPAELYAHNASIDFSITQQSPFPSSLRSPPAHIVHCNGTWEPGYPPLDFLRCNDGSSWRVNPDTNYEEKDFWIDVIQPSYVRPNNSAESIGVIQIALAPIHIEEKAMLCFTIRLANTVDTCSIDALPLIVNATHDPTNNANGNATDSSRKSDLVRNIPWEDRGIHINVTSIASTPPPKAAGKSGRVQDLGNSLDMRVGERGKTVKCEVNLTPGRAFPDARDPTKCEGNEYSWYVSRGGMNVKNVTVNAAVRVLRKFSSSIDMSFLSRPNWTVGYELQYEAFGLADRADEFEWKCDKFDYCLGKSLETVQTNERISKLSQKMYIWFD
ncbi:concanavalin A-like lectin/glucanase [Microthyrium microscopicum]|uniref:Concanavalin A-like lectin/glucanase n=1 Tax=Microthyrium microscopicum TaxID=703497 RepID=A0A6A6U5X9_9PEZI|nr:concanavalin A-like lectin/glucanase [Microthyrium microscopicum]